MIEPADDMSKAPGADTEGQTQQVVGRDAQQGQFIEPSVLGQWALYYARLGLHVMPLNGKAPIIKAWESAASNNAATVTAWWRQWPDANIGWAVARDGCVVIDCDTKTDEGGLFNLQQQLAGVGAELPNTLTAITGSGGRHLVFRVPPGFEIGNRTGVLPDVDVRGKGGQIVVAPSLHKSGQRYAWDGDFNLARAAELPQSLVDLIGSGRSRDGGKSPITGVDSFDLLTRGVPEGQRDDVIFGLCVRHLKAGDSPAAVKALAREVARQSGFPLDEADAKFDQAVKYVIEHPPDVRPDWHPDRTTPGESSSASDDDGVDNSDPRFLEELQRAERRERVNATLRERKARAAFAKPPSTYSLEEELAIDDGPIVWSVDGLHERGKNSLLAAQYKAGKTHLMINLFRSLIDGEPFLGELDVRQVDGRIAFVNNELDGPQFRRWLKEMGISNRSSGSALNLRGYNVDLTSDIGHEFIVDWLRERDVKVLILDTLARAFSGEIRDYGDMIRWTDNIDVIKREAGVEDFFLTAHTPHGTAAGDVERALGSVRLPGWADHLWFLAMNESKQRFLSASGRDVEIPETELFFDAATHRLTFGERGVGRKEASIHAHVQGVLRALANQAEVDDTKLSKSKVFAAVGGNRNEVFAAVDLAAAKGLIDIEHKGQSQLCSLTAGGRQLLAEPFKEI